MFSAKLVDKNISKSKNCKKNHIFQCFSIEFIRTSYHFNNIMLLVHVLYAKTFSKYFIERYQIANFLPQVGLV